MHNRRNPGEPRNIDGGILPAAGRFLSDLVLPRPDISGVPPLETDHISSANGALPSVPKLVLVDHVAQGAGLLYTHMSDHSVVLAATDGTRNLMAHLTPCFSGGALRSELAEFRRLSPLDSGGEFRVGVFIGYEATLGTIRAALKGARAEGFGDFLAVRSAIVGYNTVALEGEGRIVIAPLGDYVSRFFDPDRD